MDIAAIRDLFPITANYNWQNHAGVAPISKPARNAIIEYLDTCAEHVYLAGSFYKHADEVRGQIARVIGARRDEITFCKNTSDALSMIANGLNWQSGDNVVTANVEFAANVYPWQALRPRGVEVRMVLEEDGRIPLERLIESIDARTRLVTISSVQYASGFRTDLATLGDYCQSKGVLLCVDAIQSLGCFPIDVEAMHIDFLAADGHKWLCAPEGSGLMYVREELQGHLKPTSIGWASVKDPFNFDKQILEFADSAKRYDSGSYNFCGIFGLGAAFELIEQVGLESISSRLLALTDRLVDGVRSKGYRVLSSRERAEASSIVSFFSDRHDPAKIQHHLQEERRIVIAVRKGRLRSSPHFYNTEDEIDQLIDALPPH